MVWMTQTHSPVLCEYQTIFIVTKLTLGVLFMEKKRPLLAPSTSHEWTHCS